jgi:hypothetical protein
MVCVLSVGLSLSYLLPNVLKNSKYTPVRPSIFQSNQTQAIEQR